MTRVLLSLLSAWVVAGCVATEGDRARDARDPLAYGSGHRVQSKRLLSAMEKGALSESFASWADARASYTAHSTRDPDDVNALMARARTFHAQGMPRQAADLLEREVRQRLAPPLELLLATGDAVLATRRYGLAIEYYTEARRLDPRDQRARFALFTAYFLANRPEDAAKLVKNVPPSELPRHLVLLAGRAALQVDDNAYAASAFSVYLKDRPNATDVWVDLGKARFRLEQFPAARVAILRALQAQPEHPAALVLHGHLLFKVDQDLTAALAIYEHAIRVGAPPEVVRPVIDAIQARLREQATRPARPVKVPAPGTPEADPEAAAAPAEDVVGPALVEPPPSWSPEAWVGTARPRAIDD